MLSGASVIHSSLLLSRTPLTNGSHPEAFISLFMPDIWKMKGERMLSILSPPSCFVGDWEGWGDGKWYGNNKVIREEISRVKGTERGTQK